MSTRTRRLTSLTIVVVILGVALAELLVLLSKALAQGATLGVDFQYYLAYTAQWLHGGNFYAARQLTGPYVLMPGDSLYPPTAIFLFVPYVVFDAIWPLWWALPLGVLAITIVRLRPRPWAWPLLALIVAWPRTIELVLYGNPTMWMAAATAAGLFWGWPAAFVMLKPTLAPFALLGIQRRSWWIVLGLMAVMSLPLLTEWSQYPAVLLNARQSGGALYSLRDVPLMLAPLVAWSGSSTRTSWIRPPWMALLRARGQSSHGWSAAPAEPLET